MTRQVLHAITLAIAMLVLTAVSSVGAERNFLDFITGKVPVEGSLSANYIFPRTDSNIILYFNVTRLSPGPVRTHFILPENVIPFEGEVVERQFEWSDAFETVTHVLKVRVLTADRTVIRAVAVISEDKVNYLSRTFETVIGDQTTPEHPTGRRGVNAAGEPLIIFDSGQ